MKNFVRPLTMAFVMLISTALCGSGADTLSIEKPSNPLKKDHVKVYTFNIKEMIAPPVWRTTQKAFQQALDQEADLVLIHMNTYGGMVDAADSIRTKILNSPIPVFVFIDNNAASAGALISIACDSIYMAPGSNIGAATVVNQSGEVVPDKFQSYMRSMMRSTAEATGRDPEIAQAMVDPRIYIEGVIDTGRVLTFTTSEAIRNHFCEGQAESITQVMQLAGIDDYELIEHEISPLDVLINFLISPVVSGILIIVIVGGLYFELQTPGVGFPLLASITAALLYFAPLYLEGLATNIEIIIFVIGVALLMIEIFAIPGFGVTGILGILFIITGLTLAMVESVEPSVFSVDIMQLARAFFTVIIAVFLAMTGSIYLSKKLFDTNGFGHLALEKIQDKDKGFTSATKGYADMVGKHGVAHTMLRPSGKINIDDEYYDATATSSFIDAGEAIEVVYYQTGQLFVKKCC